jgi:hypothetical protein
VRAVWQPPGIPTKNDMVKSYAPEFTFTECRADKI